MKHVDARQRETDEVVIFLASHTSPSKFQFVLLQQTLTPYPSFIRLELHYLPCIFNVSADSEYTPNLTLNPRLETTEYEFIRHVNPMLSYRCFFFLI